MRTALVCAGLFACSLVPARAQLTFNLSYGEGMDASALAGFQAAAGRWSALFSDPITINLQIGFDDSPGGTILGVTNSTLYNVPYANFKTALTNDRTSANDLTAVASLQTGSSYSVLLNHPGVGDSTYVGSGDTLTITQANLHAIGMSGQNEPAFDASITFNSTFSFDFDESDGITAGKYDFIGVATHEIGHALGFYSGADVLDQNPGLQAEATVQTSLDLFRYSTLSVGSNGIFDVSADTRAKYFSIDGGATSLGEFSTGVAYGDGHQASHWKDGMGLGVMDPTGAPGELLSISALDVKAFDVIGYDLASVPEPADFALGLAVLAGGFAAWRRRTSARRGRFGGGL